MKIFMVCLSLSLLHISFAIDDPRKSDDDINKIAAERKFRSGKVHQVWEKAHRMNLPSVTIADLYIELKHHDHELMQLKALTAQGGDEDGLQQAKLQQEFNGILFKFGMAGNDRNAAFAQDLRDQKKNKEPFHDRKLNRLWKEAQLGGKFAPSELDKLFIEFKHHEDKLTELHSLNAEMEETHINSPSLHEEDEKTRMTQIKELYEDVEDGYKRLYILAKKSKDESLPFTEPRVLDLWRLMQEGNFTEDERKSLEEELKHFETRIEKHRHFREELKNAAHKVEFHGGPDEAPPEKLSKHERLQNKVMEMADKVHHTFSSLKKRITVGVIKHNEL